MPASTMRKLLQAGASLAVLTLAGAAAGCGDEPAGPSPAQANSSRVALTVTYPGQERRALITYRSGDGRRCHAFGTFTAAGPRVLGAPELPLESALPKAGRCLGDDTVSLATTEAVGGELRVIGGLAAPGVRRVVVGGERVRPSRSGAFLVVQRAVGTLGREVEVVYAGGETKRVPLATSSPQ